MFTRGLDPNEIRWVQQERRRMDPPASRNGGRDIGLPPPSKFTSGHLPSRVVRFSTADADADDSMSGSEEDSEEDLYAGNYSLDSSPQDGTIPSGLIHKSVKPLNGRPHSATDYMRSDVSSSAETVAASRRNAAERIGKLNHRYPVRQNIYREDDSTDSAASSEYSSVQVGRTSGSLPHST
uniref:Uncharacterized protein n=1 Tax=Kalanchoe fedtschenkoi TaxID=63787 RepID=A0A7N0UMB3_KALFE